MQLQSIEVKKFFLYSGFVLSSAKNDFFSYMYTNSVCTESAIGDSSLATQSEFCHRIEQPIGAITFRRPVFFFRPAVVLEFLLLSLLALLNHAPIRIIKGVPFSPFFSHRNRSAVTRFFFFLQLVVFFNVRAF